MIHYLIDFAIHPDADVYFIPYKHGENLDDEQDEYDEYEDDYENLLPDPNETIH